MHFVWLKMLKSGKASQKLGLLALIALLMGCSGIKAKSADEVVSERAIARWQALIAKDYAKAHSYLQPAYRAKYTVEQTRIGHGETLALSARVFKADCEAARCKLRLILDVINPAARSSVKRLDLVVDEIWVREDGQWWLERASP